MKNARLRRRAPAKADDIFLPAKASVGAAVFFALYGIAHPATAQQQSGSQQEAQSPASTLQEITVTATRHEQTLESVPYGISVISTDELTRSGVTDITSLASQVPGMSMFDFGTRSSGTVFPIIRGLNASAANGGFRTFEQAPVGTYIGNSPIDGYFELDDVQRVEVLKGPQGTLYGAGALGGALRIIPNAPELNTFAGDIEAGGGTVAHSSGASYTTRAMLNVPIGDTLAFRISGKYAYEPGFIDVYGLIDRTGSPVSGIPVLANPTQPVASPAIFSGRNDWNDQNTFTGRASLLWKPSDLFSAEFGFTYANVNGDGGPEADPVFRGGPYPIDPRITFPSGGNYQAFAGVDQYFWRRTTLESMDLSYDAGFATLSSTSSYFTTTGTNMEDLTYGVVSTNSLFPGDAQYYTGNPVNPRFVDPDLFTDEAHTFTQEVRLVSNTGPNKLFDYVLGVFYENQTRSGAWNYANPGSPEYSVAQGCTSPYYVGATFPECRIVSGPGDLHFYQGDTQKFIDKSVFGELTWHFLSHGQITFGGRHFDQSFTDTQSYLLYYADILLPAHSRSQPGSKNIWKVNPSYEYATGHYVYALWSQGFRRGGANALPTEGLFKENQQLLSYSPDSDNNYEIGAKGHFANGFRYTFDLFDVTWDKPQVAGSAPDGNLLVWNANRAQSKGFELDLSTPLFFSGLSVTVGGAYVDATFTENYFYKADMFGNIYGNAGQQLPGSPKVSAAATISYEHNVAPDYNLVVSLNDTYKGPMYLSTFPIAGNAGNIEASGVDIANASASVSHGAWRLGAYVTNLTDKRVVLSPGQLEGGIANSIDNLAYAESINQPRRIDLRLGYSF